MYRRFELAPRQVTHRPFTEVIGVAELAPAAGTLQFAIPALAPHPQVQRLVLLVDLVPVYPVTGPLQDSGEFVVRGQLLNLTRKPNSQNARQSSSFTNSRSEPINVWLEEAIKTIKHEHGEDLLYKVNWDVTDNDGGEGTVFVMNSFSVTPPQLREQTAPQTPPLPAR